MKFSILLVVITIGVAGHAFACKCGGPWSVKEEFEDSELIFHGKVISKELVTIQETLKQDQLSSLKQKLKGDTEKLQFLESHPIYEVKFEIIETYKGAVIRDTVTIYTATKSASCGYKFDKDKAYIVYGTPLSDIRFMFLPDSDKYMTVEKEHTFWTNHCTRTTGYNKTEAAELGKLKMKGG